MLPRVVECRQHLAYLPHPLRILYIYHQGKSSVEMVEVGREVGL